MLILESWLCSGCPVLTVVCGAIWICDPADICKERWRLYIWLAQFISVFTGYSLICGHKQYYSLVIYVYGSPFFIIFVNIRFNNPNNLTCLTSRKRQSRLATIGYASAGSVGAGGWRMEIVTKFASNVIIITSGEAPFYKDTRPEALLIQ